MSPIVVPLAVAVLVAGVLGTLGCGDDPPPAACQIEVVAHIAPLPASSDPFDYQYSEVAAKDGIAYLGASHLAGVQVLDVAAGRSIAVLDAGLGLNINSVALAGDLLAVAPTLAGLVVYDISNPRLPARRAHQPGPVSNCHTLFIHKDIVYCSTSSGAEPHVAFYRVTTPADPTAPLEVTPAGSYSGAITPEEQSANADILVHDVFVHEREGRTLAYLAYWERGLHIVDVTDPAEPRLLGASAPTPTRWTHSVWVDTTDAGTFAYVGEESYKGLVRVHDVSDPAAPVEVGQLRSTQGDAVSAHNVQVADGIVYASWYQDGLRAFPPDRGRAQRGRLLSHLERERQPREPGPIRDADSPATGTCSSRAGASMPRTCKPGCGSLRHQPGAGPCAPDRSRGTSAFAKVGRPPFGWTSLQPRRLRPGRTIPYYARLTSVDPYFEASDATIDGLQARIGMTGAVLRSPVDVLPSTGGRRDMSTRYLRARASVPSGVLPDSVSIWAELNDEGQKRATSLPIELLREAPANQDLEPNDDLWVSGMLQAPASGPARCEGTLDATDRRDLYFVELTAAAPALKFRLVTDALAEEPDQPTAGLFVSRSAAAAHEFGEPLRQMVMDAGAPSPRWEQTVTIPAGGTGTIYLLIESATAPNSASGSTYTLEASTP